MRKLVAAAALLLSACVVHERVPPPPPAPPPPPPAAAPQPRIIPEHEAMRVAADYARGKGLQVERYKAKLDRHGHWRVEVRGQRSGDRALVLVDGYSGRVLRAKLKDVDEWDD
jgi:uncharacterized iron-regulated membrane protein